MRSERLRIGVVGAGAIAQVAHLPVLSRIEEAEIVALCDPDGAKARALARRFEIPDVYDDIEELLRRSKPDAVVICTPNHLHEPHVLTALSAGAHVLCERPLALAADGVEAVRTAAEAADRVVMVSLNHRYRADAQQARTFRTGGELGQLHGIRCRWHTFKPSRDPKAWRIHREESGGGALFDLGMPLVDLALWMAPDLVLDRVTATLVRERDVPDAVEDAGVILLHGPQAGPSVLIDVSWHHVGAQEMLAVEVVGTAGSATFPPLTVYKQLHGAPVNVTPTGAARRDSTYLAAFSAQWSNFLGAIAGRVTPPGFDEYRRTLRIIEAAYESANAGTTIII